MTDDDGKCAREDVLRDLAVGVEQVRGGVTATQKTVDSLYILTTERDSKQTKDSERQEASIGKVAEKVDALFGMQRWLIGALMGAGILVGGGGVGVGVAVSAAPDDAAPAASHYTTGDDEAVAEESIDDDGDT